MIFFVKTLFSALLFTMYKVALHFNLKVSNPLSALTDRIFLSTFCSLHPRRLFLNLRLIGIKTLLLPSFLKEVGQIEDFVSNSFLNYKEIAPLKDGHPQIFLGDSHVEYYSRALTSKNSYKGRYSLWLGPKTLLGVFFAQEHLIWIDSFLKNTRQISNKPFEVLFSIGSIDARSSFYELLLKNVFLNEDELFEKYEEALEYFFHSIIIAINKIDCVNNVGVFELFPCQLPGLLPKNSKEVKVIRKSQEFPVFGTIEQRINWTNRSNDILRKLAKKHKVKYCSTFSIVNSRDYKQASADGVHVTDPCAISKIHSSFSLRQ